jgi:hypothetical protein
MVSNLALFCLATVWATFQKIGQFFQIIWSPLREVNRTDPSPLVRILWCKRCCIFKASPTIRGNSYRGSSGRTCPSVRIFLGTMFTSMSSGGKSIRDWAGSELDATLKVPAYRAQCYICLRPQFTNFRNKLVFDEGILKGEISLYRWPPVWLVWIANKNKKIVICHTAVSKPVKLEVNGTVILSPLVFPGLTQLLLD